MYVTWVISNDALVVIFNPFIYTHPVTIVILFVSQMHVMYKRFIDSSDN